MIIIIDPCLRTIFSLFSRKRTKGLAIMDISQPITKGMKNVIILGKIKHRNTIPNTATKRFTSIFKYFVDCFKINPSYRNK